MILFALYIERNFHISFINKYIVTEYFVAVSRPMRSNQFKIGLILDLYNYEVIEC